MVLPNPIPLEEIQAAADRLKGNILRTPLIPFTKHDFPFEIYLKPENLQPIGSFKLRGAGNAMEVADKGQLKQGVYTASAGNMAQGVAWYAAKLGVSCQVVVPDHAPETKLNAIERLGGKIIKVPFDEWWDVLVNREFQGMKEMFIHPVSDPLVIAGNGTIGLEILEDLPEVDTVIVPYGGGGLSCGIASAIKAIKKDVNVYASEVETAAPLSASLVENKPVKIQYKASFVDGIGSSSILAEMWPLASSLLDGALVNSLEEIAISIRNIFEKNRMLAEGAGASSLASVNKLKNPKKVVCIISGGNIDSGKLISILQGKVP